MSIKFDRSPFGWVHPFRGRSRLSRSPRHYRKDLDMDDFAFPSFGGISSLNDVFQLDDNDLLHSTKSQKAEPKPDFELKIDVQQFTPEELDVKMVGECIVVEGKHEERQDEHGYISRHFSRRYQLPDDVKAENIVCNLNADGVLRLSAPRIVEIENKEKEKVIQVTVSSSKRK